MSGAIGDRPSAFSRRDRRRAFLAAQVRDVLGEHVPYVLEGLSSDDAFVKDLRMDELDSMSTAELVLSLEQRFGIKIPGDDAQRILNFRELADYLEKRVPADRLAPWSERAVER